MAGKGKIVRGALEALTDIFDVIKKGSDEPADPSRRDLLKGAAGAAALGALPTAVRVSAMHAGIEDVLPVAAKTLDLPRLIDLPSYKQAIDALNITQWDENVDMYDDVEAAEIITERLEDFDLSFADVGIDQNNITKFDLLNPVFVEKTGIATDASISSGLYNDEGILQDDMPNVVRWLNDEIPLDEIDESSASVAGTIIRDLMENYGLTKRQVGEYLHTEGFDIAGPKSLDQADPTGRSISGPPSTADDVYHVTFTRNLPDIQEKGLNPLSESLWLKQETGERYQQDPSIYSFSDPEDALQWASKMRYEFGDADISLVRLRGGQHWAPDSSEDLNLPKSSRRSSQPIDPKDVLEVFPVPKPAGINEEFQREVPGGGFNEWKQYYGRLIRESQAANDVVGIENIKQINDQS
jgi:hypothetical protein